MRQDLEFPTLGLWLPRLLSGDNAEARVANLMPQSNWRTAEKCGGKAREGEQRDCGRVWDKLLFFLTHFRLSGGLWSHMGASYVGAD